MEEQKLDNWEDFERKIKELFDLVKKAEEKTKLSASAPLFRGQSDRDWRLSTTLDRVKVSTSMEKYYNLIRSVKPAIESYTNLQWELPEYKEPDNSFWRSFPTKQYSYMIYLRHHGFPSPFLDWTLSPYIGAFFAVSDIKSDKDTALFAYVEDLGYGKSALGNEPIIASQGPFITAHKRHHLQQCEYTICTKNKDGKAHYWNHEDVFQKNDPEQDLLIKYILPSSLKSEFLRKLDLMNINAYSLFVNEESLMHTLSIRELFLNGRL